MWNCIISLLICHVPYQIKSLYLHITFWASKFKGHETASNLSIPLIWEKFWESKKEKLPQQSNASRSGMQHGILHTYLIRIVHNSFHIKFLIVIGLSISGKITNLCKNSEKNIVFLLEKSTVCFSIMIKTCWSILPIVKWFLA